MTNAFIHVFPDLEEFELLCESNNAFLNDFEIKERSFEHDLEMLRYMGESTDDLEYMMESEKKGFFEMIGEKILQIIKWFEDKCAALVEKVGSLFKKPTKTDEEIDAAWKKNPELAKAFMDGLKNGSIKYSDYENIDKMVDDAVEIIKQLESDKISSKTAVDKFNDVVEKFNKTLVPSATLLATLGAGAAGIVSIMGFRNKLRKEILDGRKYAKKLEALDRIDAEKYYADHGVKFVHGVKKNKAGQTVRDAEGNPVQVHNYHYSDKNRSLTDANGNIDPKLNKKTAAEWALRISQKAASEYNKPLEIMYKCLADITALVTSNKLFDNHKTDIEGYAQKQFRDGKATAYDAKKGINEENKLDKAIT